MKRQQHILDLPGRKPIIVTIFDFPTALILGVQRDETPNSAQEKWLKKLVRRTVKPHHRRVDVVTSSPE